MRRAFSLVALVIGAAGLTGCQYGAYFFRDTHRPVQALDIQRDPYVRSDCLVVLMPGMLDLPDQYLEHGFIEDAMRRPGRCDFVAVDAHFAYYREGSLRRAVGEDIIVAAQARGYESIWIVGISMGGLGALLVAEEYAQVIDGIVLLAPFLGDEALVRSIEEAGGLEAWDAPEGMDRYDEDEFDDELWGWLQGYATEPSARPPLYIGVGTEDRLRPGVGLLAQVLPDERSGEAEGGHDWATWRVLWRRLLASPPWDPAAGVPRIDR